MIGQLCPRKYYFFVGIILYFYLFHQVWVGRIRGRGLAEINATLLWGKKYNLKCYTCACAWLSGKTVRVKIRD